MNHNEKKMVDAVVTDNPAEFVSSFKKAMTDRVSQKLDDERNQVSKEIVTDKPTEEN